MNYYFLTAGLLFILLAVFYQGFRPARSRGEDGAVVLGLTAAVLLVCAVVSQWV